MQTVTREVSAGTAPRSATLVGLVVALGGAPLLGLLLGTARPSVEAPDRFWHTLVVRSTSSFHGQDRSLTT